MILKSSWKYTQGKFLMYPLQISEVLPIVPLPFVFKALWQNYDDKYDRSQAQQEQLGRIPILTSVGFV